MTVTDELPGGWRPGGLAGVLMRRMTVHPDPRGAFGELWRAPLTDPLGAPGERMVQANLSRSQPRVLRGMHAHQHQADLWIVVEGHPWVALVDLRPAIAGIGPVQRWTVATEPGDTLYLPRGVAHGFYAPDQMMLTYLVSNLYDGSDELGFRWDDPDAAIGWPDAQPILSDRDAVAPSLADLVARWQALDRVG